MTTHGLGCIPDHRPDVDEDLRERHVGMLIGAEPSTLPTHVDYSHFLGRVPDQLNTNSCVGQAFATSIYLRAQIMGEPLPRPSAKAIYDIARLIDTPGELADVGSRPRAALLGMQEYGLVADERWPLTIANVDEPPPLDVFRAGLAAMLSGYYRIGGGDLATLARIALARGFLPFFAMPTDESFRSYDGSAPWDGLRGPLLGYHAMTLVGYAPGFLYLANSWGSRWGAAGFGRITDGAFNAIAFDVLVPTVIPSRLT